MEWTEKIRRAFFTLLRSGLWNQDIEDKECFPLSDLEWKIIWKHALRQSVRGLVFDGVCLLPEQLMPDIQLIMVWAAEIEHIERRNHQMNKVLLTLVRVLKERHVNPLVLKGQGVAQFYEHPLLRECGDIDLYFTDQNDEQILLDWIKLKNLAIRKEPDGTYTYVLGGIDVEHHHRIFDLYASNIQEYLFTLVQNKGFTSLSINADAESGICVLSPILNILSLNVHILKHLMGHGIGLRQFCDLARAYHELHQSYDGVELKECYHHCRLLRWSRLLHTMLVRDLGLPIEKLPYKDDLLPSTDYLLNRVIAEGNFGKYTSVREYAPIWKRKLHTGMAFFGNLRFSLTYAPQEVFGLVGDLFIGNFKS